MTYIPRYGIDKKVRDEKELHYQERHTIDQLSGLSQTKGAMRQDFKLCRENDKLLKDFRSFRNPKDRNKITKEMDYVRKEYRDVKSV